MEAAQRHADKTIENLNLEEANGVTSACEEETRWEYEGNGIVLENKNRIQYCEFAARIDNLVGTRQMRSRRCEETDALGEIHDSCATDSSEVHVANRTGKPAHLV